MRKKILKTFDLENRRPKVVLFGNGLLRSKTSPSWEAVLCELAGKNPEEYQIDKWEGVSYPALADLLLNTEDKIRNNRYETYFFETAENPSDSKKHYPYEEHPMLRLLLELDFDAFLTTNYTYEAEDILCPGFHTFSKNKMRNLVSSTTEVKTDERRICVCNEFQTNAETTKEIWHIHGEARNKSWIVMTHDEYSRQVSRVIAYCRKRKNEYEIYKNEFKIKSWVDLFLVSDLYILGFGFSFSEIDLWWLLNRRIRERSGHGKVVFFEPKAKDGEHMLHAQLLGKHPGVSVNDCEITLSEDEDKNKILYQEFYEKAIQELREILKGEK